MTTSLTIWNTKIFLIDRWALKIQKINFGVKRKSTDSFKNF